MTTPTDTAKLADEIEALAKDATPGKWMRGADAKSAGVAHPDWGSVYIIYTDGLPTRVANTFSPALTSDDEMADCRAMRSHGSGEWREPAKIAANAALIVALVNSAPTIIAALRELDALKAENAKLREAMKSALKRLEKGAPGWGVAKDELRAALGGAG